MLKTRNTKTRILDSEPICFPHKPIKPEDRQNPTARHRSVRLQKMGKKKKIHRSVNNPVGEIYQKYNKGLTNFLIRRLDSQAEVEDVSQDVYLKLLQHNKTLEQPSLSLLCKIAANIIIDRFRYRRTRKEFDHIPFEDFQIKSLEATPEQMLKTKEGVARYMQGFEELSKKQQKAFVLSRLKGLTYDEVALEMGTTKHMVKKYITGAVVKLRKKFG